MTVAIRCEARWHLSSPEPVGDTSDLLERLKRRAVSPGAVLVGFDFPIGLPAHYGEKTGLPHFRAALTALGQGEWADWFTVCDEARQISILRPFYPMRPGGTSRANLLTGLTLTAEQVLRLCEKGTPHRSPACSIFWTLGGNQVGKGAISGWQEILKPNLNLLKVWPFDGTIEDLSQSANMIVAETYPGEVYHQLELPRRGWSKRKQAGRRHVAPMLEARITKRGYHLAEGFYELIKDGFTASLSGEDEFDALVGMLGMLDVVEGHRPEGFPTDPRTMQWEGWILGQAPSER